MNTTESVPTRAGVIAGLFHDPAVAAQALTQLRSAGFSRVEISQVAGADQAAAEAQPAADATDARFFQEHESHASSFVDELASLGFSKHDAHDLVEGVVEGGAVVTADAKNDVDRAAAVLTRNHADVRYAQRAATSRVRDTGALAAAGASAAQTDDQVLQLRAERLAVDKRRVQHGEARIHKEVVTKTQTIDVPVTHEELVIERVPASGTVTSTDTPIGASETIRIPLTEERVDVSKHTAVIEEVTIGKREVTGTEHISETVRSEEVVIDDPTARRTTRDSSEPQR